ncbi:hypothetical protein SDC9_93215 [bioreactor metagenome]|uniref:Uncharacterized protein n=1 Tax=bioreactor metagenome TaxID=1076179 RepID=A0A645A0F7_9ZZZZ
MYVMVPGIFGCHFFSFGIIAHYAKDLLPERADGGFGCPDSVFRHENRTVYPGNGQVFGVSGSRISSGCDAILLQVIFFENACCKRCSNIFEGSGPAIQIVAVGVNLNG